MACSCGSACESCQIGSDGTHRCLAVASCSSAFKPFDLVVVLDSSDYMGAPSFPFALTFVENLILALPVGPNDVHVALVSFAEGAILDFNLEFSFDGHVLASQAATVSFQGGVPLLAEALDFVRTKLVWSTVNGYRGGDSNVVIVGEGLVFSVTSVIRCSPGSRCCGGGWPGLACTESASHVFHAYQVVSRRCDVQIIKP